MKFELIHPNAKLPSRGSEGAAGLDLYATEDVIVRAGEITKIPLGIKSQIPRGWFALIKSRGSTGIKGLDVYAGVVDYDYRGEWIVVLFNSSTKHVYFEAGDRIAQAVLMQYYNGPVMEDYVNDTVRGEGRFGSTGK